MISDVASLSGGDKKVARALLVIGGRVIGVIGFTRGDANDVSVPSQFVGIKRGGKVCLGCCAEFRSDKWSR